MYFSWNSAISPAVLGCEFYKITLNSDSWRACVSFKHKYTVPEVQEFRSWPFSNKCTPDHCHHCTPFFGRFFCRYSFLVMTPKKLLETLFCSLLALSKVVHWWFSSTPWKKNPFVFVCCPEPSSKSLWISLKSPQKRITIALSDMNALNLSESVAWKVLRIPNF